MLAAQRRSCRQLIGACQSVLMSSLSPSHWDELIRNGASFSAGAVFLGEAPNDWLAGGKSARRKRASTSGRSGKQWPFEERERPTKWRRSAVCGVPKLRWELSVGALCVQLRGIHSDIFIHLAHRALSSARRLREGRSRPDLRLGRRRSDGALRPSCTLSAQAKPASRFVCP